MVRLTFFVITLLIAASPCESRGDDRVGGIAWDQSTLRYLGPGVYPRMIRLRDGEILFSCDAGGSAMVRRSTDDGATWSEPVAAATFAHGSAANAEIIELDDGRIILFYNERPRRDGKHPFTIRMCTSRNGGRTWAARDEPLYVADTKFANGCWEPAAVQLPSGEALLFFANENPYRDTAEQEISLMRSSDRGATWSAARTFAVRRGKRDGMPVPVLLADGKTVAVAIEDEGPRARQKLQPAILRWSPDDAAAALPIPGDDPRRQSALGDSIAADVYAGAPFLRTLPSGETILSCHSDEGGRREPQMVVYVGDANGRGFAHRSVPFALPADVGGMIRSTLSSSSAGVPTPSRLDVVIQRAPSGSRTTVRSRPYSPSRNCSGSSSTVPASSRDSAWTRSPSRAARNTAPPAAVQPPRPPSSAGTSASGGVSV